MKWRPWMEPYRDMIANTGGNPIEELLADENTHFGNNAVRACLIACVDSQVILLQRMKHAGVLKEKGE